jgi:hypothetical protein
VVLKLNSAGEHQWHTFYGSVSKNDYGQGIAVDTSGNVYVTGYSAATWNGPLGVAPLHAYSGGNDIVVLKLNSAGAYQWHTFYGSAGSGDIGQGIAVDTSGNVYVTGYSNATWGAPLHAHSGGGADIVVLKLNSAGAYQWHTFYGTTGTDSGQGIAVDTSGNVYVTGYSFSTWNGPVGVAPLNAFTGGYEIVVLKLSGAATHFTVSAPASATAGTAFSYTVTALDASNNTATGYAGTVHFTSSDVAATLPVNSTLTNGVGTFSATLRTAGNQTITATDTVTSSITVTSSTIVVSAGAATHFTVSAPASATAGTAFFYTVTALDASNNTATGYAGTVHFTSSDGVSTLPANSTLTSGVGTFSATLRTAGNQTITATDTVTSSITVTSSTIVVSAGAATHFTVSAPASATAGTVFSFTVTALDQFGNMATGYAGTVQFTSSDGAGTVPANATLTNGTGTFSATLATAGNQTISVTDTGNALITGSSGAVAVSVPTAVPTMTEWGMMAFMILAAAGAVYYLRRRETPQA